MRGLAALILCASIGSPAADLEAEAHLSVAVIPIPPSIERFPDPSFWPGSGPRQVANMLVAIKEEAAEPVMTAGPGPNQLAARWLREGTQLSENERILVLLSGWAFHDRAMFPVYEDAFRSGTTRVRQAAAVGLLWLVGENPPDPASVPNTAESWAGLERLSRFLRIATRSRTLVGIWVDSYLENEGLPRRPGLVFRTADASRCLAAIRTIATPADLDELVALWPQLRTAQQRYFMVRAIEAAAAQPFMDRPSGERTPTGDWLYEIAAWRIDNWARGMCREVDGIAYLQARMRGLRREHVQRLTRRGRRSVAPERSGAVEGPSRLEYQRWLELLDTDAPPSWKVAVESLTGYGAPAVILDLSVVESDANKKAVRKVRAYFPVSK